MTYQNNHYILTILQYFHPFTQASEIQILPNAMQIAGPKSPIGFNDKHNISVLIEMQHIEDIKIISVHSFYCNANCKTFG